MFSRFFRFKIMLLLSVFIFFSINTITIALQNEIYENVYNVTINKFLAFENVKLYNNAYYVPVDHLITLLDAQKDQKISDEHSIFIIRESSYRIRYEAGPFKIDMDTSNFSGFKMLYWNYKPLYVNVVTYNNIEYIDLNIFCQKMGYNISVTNSNINILTNEYSKMQGNAKIRLILLPSNITNVSAVAEKLVSEPYTEDIAEPFAKSSYLRLAELFNNLYSAQIEIITIDKYLEDKKWAKQTDATVKLLSENIKYSDLTALIGNSYNKQGNIYGKSFEWQQAEANLSVSAKATFEDMLKTENAQGVIYTSIEQIGSNTGWYGGGFYFKYRGFCYLTGGTILPIRNDDYNFQNMYYNSTNRTVNNKAQYTYYPIYHNKGKLYYIIPLSFMFSGYQIGNKVDIINKDNNEVNITSSSNKTVNVNDISFILGENTITIDQYVSGMQTGQALAALDEVIPKIFKGIQYSILTNTNSGNYVRWLYNFEAARRVCKIEDSVDFNKTYAELLIRNGFYEDASKFIKTNNILITIPEYKEMLALEALQNGDMDQAEKLFIQIIENYKLLGNIDMVNEFNKKIFYLYKSYIKDMESKKKYGECAKVCEYLAVKDPYNAKQYFLSAAEFYEKALQPRDAYNKYVKYLELAKNDEKVEAKAHNLAVTLKIDDINDTKVKKILQKAGFNLIGIKYYLYDANNDTFKDIIIVSMNDIQCLVYKNGEYSTGSKDAKIDKEIFDDIDKDGLPEIVASRKGISGYSCIKFNEPYIETIKFRELFSSKYIEQQNYVKELKSKEAALAKLFHVIGSKNTKEYSLIPLNIQKFIEANKLNKDKKILTKSVKQKPGDTLAIIIQSNSYDKKVVFSFSKIGNSYNLTGIISEEKNKELWSTDFKGLVD